MALLGSLNTGASGVKTQGKTMQIVGNNIANVNTFGFKRNGVAFDDLIVMQLGNELRRFPFKNWIAWRIILPELPGFLYFRE